MPGSDSSPKPADLLATIPTFAGLDATTLEAVVQVAILRRYGAGEIVFLESEPCAGLYVVQEGWLKASKIALTGREQVVRFVRPGEAFNEIGVLAGGNNRATVQAQEPALVWMVPREPLIRLMEHHPPLAQAITRSLAQRVLHLMGLVEDLSLRPVAARLARVLLDHSTGEVMDRRRWSTQAEMAARLGTVPEVLNRALSGLAAEALIGIERHRIRILDREGLEAKAMLSE